MREPRGRLGGWLGDLEMTEQHVVLARAVLAVCAAGAVLAQVVVLPRLAAGYADRYAEVAYLERPYLVVALLTVGASEVALVAMWQLLAVGDGAGAARRARRWVQVMAAALWSMAASRTVPVTTGGRAAAHLDAAAEPVTDPGE